MKRLYIIGVLALAGVLAACGGAVEEAAQPVSISLAPSHAVRDSAVHDAAGSGATVTFAPTTTTTEVVEAAPVAGKGGVPSDPMAVMAVSFYEDTPYGGDLTCEGMARDITISEGFFSASDWLFVKEAIIDRAEKEGCPVS